MEWAGEQGGELPNRVECALLFATLKSEFEEKWYWTRETHASDSASAWCQYFDHGSQLNAHKDSIPCPARAVRRLPVGD